MSTVRIERCPECNAMVGEGTLYEHQQREHRKPADPWSGVIAAIETGLRLQVPKPEIMQRVREELDRARLHVAQAHQDREIELEGDRAEAQQAADEWRDRLALVIVERDAAKRQIADLKSCHCGRCHCGKSPEGTPVHALGCCKEAHRKLAVRQWQLAAIEQQDAIRAYIDERDALRGQLSTAQQEIEKVREQGKDGCPCRHTTPCHPRCTCVQPHSSVGCSRCCRYGSPEQQKAMAEHLSPLKEATTPK